MADLTRLRRLSRVLNAISLVLMILLPVVIVMIWLNWDAWKDSFANSVGVADALVPDTISPVQRALGIAVTLLPAGVLIFGLFWLRRLFGAFAEGRVFTAENIRAIRLFAWSIVVMHLVEVFANALLTVIITMDNAPGSRVLALQWGSDETIAVFVGLVFVAIAHALDEGRRLADDSASIV